MNGFDPWNWLHSRALCSRFFCVARPICCIEKPDNFEVGDYFENICKRIMRHSNFYIKVITENYHAVRSQSL